MQQPDSPSDAARLHAKVGEFVAAIDDAIDRGRALEARYDAFCREHDIHPGEGEETLTAETVRPGTRYIRRNLIDLRRRLYDEFLGPSAPPRGVSTTSASLPSQRIPVAAPGGNMFLAFTAPRALASRTRI